jgi:hypothetical protein
MLPGSRTISAGVAICPDSEKGLSSIAPTAGGGRHYPPLSGRLTASDSGVCCRRPPERKVLSILTSQDWIRCWAYIGFPSRLSHPIQTQVAHIAYQYTPPTPLPLSHTRAHTRVGNVARARSRWIDRRIDTSTRSGASEWSESAGSLKKKVNAIVLGQTRAGSHRATRRDCA